MRIEICFKDGSNEIIENLKEIKTLSLDSSDGSIHSAEISVDELFISENKQYHFIGDLTAIIPGDIIKYVVVN